MSNKGHFTLTVELPREISVALGKGSTRTNDLRLDELDAKVIRFACIAGFEGALGNISKASLITDDNPKPSDDDWFAAREKRMKPWKDGTGWKATGEGSRGDSVLSAIREQYIAETMADRAMTRAQVEREIKDVVANQFGKDEKATFDKFMLAVAHMTLPEGTPEEVTTEYEEIEAALKERAEEARIAREEAAKKLSTSGIVIRKK